MLQAKKQTLYNAGHGHLVPQSFRVHVERCHQQEVLPDERDRSSPMLTSNLLRYCQLVEKITTSYVVFTAPMSWMAADKSYSRNGEVVLLNKLYCDVSRSEDSNFPMSV